MGSRLRMFDLRCRRGAFRQFDAPAPINDDAQSAIVSAATLSSALVRARLHMLTVPRLAVALKTQRRRNGIVMDLTPYPEEVVFTMSIKASWNRCAISPTLISDWCPSRRWSCAK